MVHTNILHSTRSSDASQKRANRLATKAVDSSKGNRTVIHQKQSDFDFGRTGFQADREGIAVYARPDGTGFVVCTDQIASNSLYRFYRREGEPGRPHNHEALLGVVGGRADSTDGIEITAHNLGPRFPSGLASGNECQREELSCSTGWKIFYGS